MTKSTTKPELIFGIIAKIGTNTDKVIDLISNALIQYDYEPHTIKLTTLIREPKIKSKISIEIKSDLSLIHI